MADLQHVDFKGRRLRLAWEETRRRVDREDDPLPDLEDAERDAWDEWEHWATDAEICPWCCATTVNCPQRACLR